MRKIEKFIVELCEDVFGVVSTANKKKLKKTLSQDEIEDMIAFLDFDRVKYDQVVKDIKKRFDKPKFFNIPAVSAIEDLFFDVEAELKFGDKVIEGKEGTIFYNDDGKTENQFFGTENYLLYILMFTFSGRKTSAEEMYKFCISSNTRINQKNIDEFERKIVNLARRLRENEVNVEWQGKNSLLLSKFEQTGKELFFDCQRFRDVLGKKMISVPVKLVGKSKFSVVLKKLMIIKEIRDWKRFGSKYSSKIVVGRIERKLKSEISNEFLKQFLEHLKDNRFIGACEVKTQNFAKSIIFQKSNEKPLTPYVKNGNTIAYYLKGSFAKKLIGKYYMKANYHVWSNSVRFDDNLMKLTKEEQDKLSNFIMLNLGKMKGEIVK